MSRRQITGFSNPTVKALRALRDKKHRKAAGQFLAEGLRLLTDARECGHLPKVLVMAEGRDPHPLLGQLEADVIANGGEVIETSADILSKITGKDNPQAVCGVFAEFGAGGLILIDDCADPFSAEAVRASMGAVFTQQIAQARWDEFLPWLRSGAGQLVAASLRDAVPYRGAPYAAPCVIMVGNESRGLPEDYEAACDLRVTMPMKGRADSLNAAVAGAVLAYEVLEALGG